MIIKILSYEKKYFLFNLTYNFSYATEVQTNITTGHFL